MTLLTNLKRIAVLGLVLGCAGGAWAQQEESINTDRPDKSDGTYTMPQGDFQLENEFLHSEGLSTYNAMLRYGLTKTTELRFLAEGDLEDQRLGLKPVKLSIKQKLWEQKGALPAATIVGYATFGKFASKEYQEEKIPLEARLAFQNELSDSFSISYNVGLSNKWRDKDVTIGVQYSPAHRITTFVEYFATYSDEAPQHNLDAGFLYAITPRLQFDMAAGKSLFSDELPFYGTVGLSYWFQHHRNQKP